MISRENKERLSNMVRKFLKGQASPQEKEFIARYYRYFDRFDAATEGMSEQERAALEQRMLKSVLDKTRAKAKRNRRLLFRAAVLAGVLLFSAGLYLSLRRNAPDPAFPAQSAREDLLPGGDKAVLTLDNGEMIVLDDIGEGSLGTQGSNLVRKTGEGELSYVSLEDGVERQSAFNRLSTPRGGQYRLIMPDGTRIWLNAATSIRYAAGFGEKERVVELRGEAYFDVAPDPSRPFRVIAGDKVEIQVTGTRFNVTAYEEEAQISTSLLEGSVTLRPGPGQAFREAVLEPGQMGTFERQGLQIREADMEEVTAWQKGLFLFKSADIPSIMRQLARWYDVEVIYMNEVPSARISGKIPRSMRASQVLKILEISGIEVKIEGGKIIIM